MNVTESYLLLSLKNFALKNLKKTIYTTFVIRKRTRYSVY